ncbi:MAG: hypothetical protein ABWY12_09680 [Burkholderiales bacterium]
MPQCWICDFCSDPVPRWLYRATNIDYPSLKAESLSAWVACETCSDLIERNEKIALAKRTANMMCARHPEFEPVATLGEVVYLHGTFFKHRIDGPRLPLPDFKKEI